MNRAAAFNTPSTQLGMFSIQPQRHILSTCPLAPTCPSFRVPQRCLPAASSSHAHACSPSHEARARTSDDEATRRPQTKAQGTSRDVFARGSTMRDLANQQHCSCPMHLIRRFPPCPSSPLFVVELCCVPHARPSPNDVTAAGCAEEPRASACVRACTKCGPRGTATHTPRLTTSHSTDTPLTPLLPAPPTVPRTRPLLLNSPPILLSTPPLLCPTAMRASTFFIVATLLCFLTLSHASPFARLTHDLQQTQQVRSQAGADFVSHIQHASQLTQQCTRHARIDEGTTLRESNSFLVSSAHRPPSLCLCLFSPVACDAR